MADKETNTKLPDESKLEQVTLTTVEEQLEQDVLMGDNVEQPTRQATSPSVFDQLEEEDEQEEEQEEEEDQALKQILKGAIEGEEDEILFQVVSPSVKREAKKETEPKPLPTIEENVEPVEEKSEALNQTVLSSKETTPERSPQIESKKQPTEVIPTPKVQESKVDADAVKKPNVTSEKKPRTIKDRLAALFAAMQKRCLAFYASTPAVPPSVKKGVSFLRRNFSWSAKTASGLLTSWFGLFLKASAILSLGSLVPTFIANLLFAITPAFLLPIITSPLAMGLATLAAVTLLPVSVLLPLAALAFIAVPLTTSLLGLWQGFTVACAIAISATVINFTYDKFRRKNATHGAHESRQLRWMGESTYLGAERFVTNIESMVYNAPVNIRYAANYASEKASEACESLPRTPACITNAFNAAKKAASSCIKSSNVTADRKHKKSNAVRLDTVFI